MPHNAVNTLLDDNGFTVYPVSTATVAAGVGTTTIKSGAGRLAKVTVTTVGTANALTFYDSVGTASGTVLGVIPGTTVAGTVVDLQMPAQFGITAVGASGSGAVTVSYS